jgi:polar amino acid transport system substrate-binding protein
MTSPSPLASVPAELVRRLAPSGILRAGINLSNFLLVSAWTPDGGPAGVSPDLARALAEGLGLGVRYVTYASPSSLADAVGRDEWDVALIGAEPQRAEAIAFTPAYAEIEATYLVPPGSPLTSIADVDRPGVRIAVTEGTAFGLWLDRNIRHAELVPAATMDETLQLFLRDGADTLAGLRARLVTDARSLPGSRMLDGRFMTVQQAIGIPRQHAAIVPYLAAFVDHARASGLVAELIRRHGVSDLSVAG